MRKSTGIGMALALQFGLQACGDPSTNVPGTDLFIEAADGKYHGPMTELRIQPATATVEIGLTQNFNAIGVFEDGTEVGITDKVYWQVGDNNVVQQAEAFVDGALQVTGKAEGTTQLSIQLGTLTGAASLEAIPAKLAEFALTSEAEGAVIGRGSRVQLTATGRYNDGRLENISELVTWSSSDEAIIRVSASGMLTAVADGQATVTAAIEGMSSELTYTVECAYPADAPATVQHYETLPYAFWETAQDKDGNVFNFDFEDVVCAPAWEDTQTIVFVVSTEWCPYCPDRMRWVESLQPQFSQHGMRVVIMESQDRQGRDNMTTAKAAAHINDIVPNIDAIRLGDMDSRPRQNIFVTSPGFIRAFPTVFVVRTRDMKIIANQNDGNRLLDLVSIAQNPEWNWRDPENPVQSFQSNCSEAQEEPFEPNDVVADAKSIGPSLVEGGICADGPDFYRIAIPGRWRATMLFDNAEGNLDMYVWNENSNSPLIQNRREVGSYGDTGAESFEFEGEAVLRVQGRTNDSTTYQLFIEEL